MFNGNTPEKKLCATIQKRYEFSLTFNELSYSIADRNFIFIDEVGFSVYSRTKRGRSLIGTTPVIETAALRSRNISIVAAATIYGMLDYKINYNPVNGVDFKEYMSVLKEKCVEIGINNPIFIMDNARIHHCIIVRQAVVDLGMDVLFLPPYSPMLNIIENCFSKWKNYVLRGAARCEAELMHLIGQGFEKISSDDCDGYFRLFLRNIERSRNREVIHE